MLTNIARSAMLRGPLTHNWIFIAIVFVSLKMASHSEGKQKFPMAARTNYSEFYSNFHKIIAHKTEGNIVNSPLSVHLALSYLFHGSDTHTAREMIAGLHLSDAKQVSLEYKDFIEILNSLQTVKVATALYVQANVKLYTTFRNKGTDFFNVEIKNINFDDNIESARVINEWVSQRTNDKIKDIISSGDIDEYTRVILVNAVYFKGQWQHPFNKEATEKRLFHLNEDSNKLVPTMYKEFKFSHGEIPSLNSRFLEIPYTDAKMNMIIILPNEIKGLTFVEEHFDWNAVMNAERTTNVTKLFLPKFKVESSIELKDILTELGFTSMFEDTADFTKISDVPLKVDSVIQKAFLEVDEVGTEAAAATVVRMIQKRSLRMEEPDQFVVDRPFVVAICYDNIPLFLSSVRDIHVSFEKDEL